MDTKQQVKEVLDRRNTQDRRDGPGTIIAHKAVVEAGGGVYVPGMLGNLVLFNSIKTRSTLALPENLLTTEAVAAKIAESDTKFGV